MSAFSDWYEVWQQEDARTTGTSTGSAVLGLALAEDGRPTVRAKQTQPAQPPPVPESREIVAPSADGMEEYAQVAASIGFAPKSLRLDAVRRWLACEGFRVYDRKQVATFLDAQFGKASGRTMEFVRWGASWCWRPMRESDRTHRSEYARPEQTQATSSWVIGAGTIQIGEPLVLPGALSANDMLAREAHSYEKPIPLPVLLTAQRVLAQFPNAKFFVSDEVAQTEKPYDPFLLVLIEDEAFIIERWDEPNYRER